MQLQSGQVYVVKYHAEPKSIDPFLIVDPNSGGNWKIIRLTDMFETYMNEEEWFSIHFPYEVLGKLF